MKLLVTGGAGFIGSNFIRNSKHNIVVLDLLTYAGRADNVEQDIVVGDVCDFEVVDELVGSVDAVVHFAAESHVDKSITSGTDFVRTNVLGTQQVLEACKKHSVRLLYVSTDEVYGSIESGSWDESSPLQPNSPYSASKASGDLLVQAYAKTYGMDACITRCSNNYGPYQFPEKVIPLFVTNILRGKKIPIYGNGLNVRDWIHVNDHCRAISTVLESGKQGVFNIGGDNELTNIELAGKIIDLMNVDWRVVEYINDRLGHDFRYSVDSSKIKSLGFYSTVDFDDGLASTIKWYTDNANWWSVV